MVLAFFLAGTEISESTSPGVSSSLLGKLLDPSAVGVFLVVQTKINVGQSPESSKREFMAEVIHVCFFLLDGF